MAQPVCPTAEHSDEEENIDPETPDGSENEYTISKIGRNQYAEPSGEAFWMPWEIYVSQDIEKAMDMKLVSRLKEKLILLGVQQDDWRVREPILNIIDPDLYVLKIYNKNRHWLSKKLKEEINHNFDRREYGSDEEDHPDNRWKKVEQLHEKGYFIRRRYQWLATQFKETDDGNIEIVSPIHNLSPRNKYEELYRGIEYVFQKMLPIFNRFPAFCDRTNKEFQVIVKAQRYEVEDMSGYSGHWHQEGLTENIIIGGLYYFDKDYLLKGGNLQFKNKRGPDDQDMEMYPEFHDFEQDGPLPKIIEEVEVNEGTAVVFDNVNLVHRVRMLKNKGKDEKKRYRAFLAFFIVDPMNPIESTRNHPSLKKDKFIEAIIKYSPIESTDIASLICELALSGYTLEEAKEMRELNIECRKNPSTRGKWAGCHFGNHGETFWFKHGKAHSPQWSEHIGSTAESASSGSGQRTKNMSKILPIQHLMNERPLDESVTSLTFVQKGDLERAIKRFMGMRMMEIRHNSAFYNDYDDGGLHENENQNESRHIDEKEATDNNDDPCWELIGIIRPYLKNEH